MLSVNENLNIKTRSFENFVKSTTVLIRMDVILSHKLHSKL